MKLQVLGCSHHETPLVIRERLAFNPDQTAAALAQLRDCFPKLEAVLLSTCNRVELYCAAEQDNGPSPAELTGFLADFHQLDVREVQTHLAFRENESAIRHLFTVAASLDSMVLGEPQILAQVKQAYQIAQQYQTTGPLTHAAFQAAVKVARRVATETAIHQRRVSIPSVAVADFAQQIFERFDDKNTLVIGAGEMAEETLRYLRDEGASQIVVINRHHHRAVELAERWSGRALPWDDLPQGLVEADLIISTTGAERPIVTLADFTRIAPARRNRPLFVLDLAVPRDFETAIGELPEVYLYSVDDLRQACERNRRQRDRELPAALRIIDQETGRFMADLCHRASAPIIEQLRREWHAREDEELRRLYNKLPQLDDHAREEIRQSFDRLINKLLHPPLESLRDESRHGIPQALVEALSKLFRLRD
ncbi:MAG: glutamyl-tRNA reductase [Thermoguttaceae bacterium]|nr:glutamyl-tRNA reductase [Thermoguttaceae bacterium]